MRVLALADVGGPELHVGDEAMLAANLALLRDQLPAATASVIGRPATPQQVGDAVLEADAVLLSGGGNLSSTWPHLLEQRIILIEAAAAAGVPVVTGGQTIGPAVDEPERSRLAAALRTVALLGVREQPSRDLARAWGVPDDRVVVQVDDAFTVADAEPEDASLVELADDGFIAVTLDGSFAVPDARPGLQSLAAQLAALATRIDRSVLTVPHVGGLGARTGPDADAHRALAALLRLAGARVREAAVPSVPEAAWLHRAARLTVSSRYHPLVFATSAGGPCLGLARDRYTGIKLRGALAHVGDEEWVQDVASAEAGGLLTRATALLEARDADGSEGRARRTQRLVRLREVEHRRRIRLVGVLGGSVTGHDDDGPGADDRGPAARGHGA